MTFVATGRTSEASTGPRLISLREALEKLEIVPAPMSRRIPDGWHRLCSYDELSEASPIMRTIADLPVVLVREGDAVTAMIERCAHQGGPLADGARSSRLAARRELYAPGTKARTA
jgi:hypothetical protein